VANWIVSRVQLGYDQNSFAAARLPPEDRVTVASAQGPRSKRPRIAKAVSAVGDTWFGQVLRRARTLCTLIVTYLAATGAVLKWFLQDFLAFHEQHPATFWPIVVGPLLFILAFDSFPWLLQKWREKQRSIMALQPVVAASADPYFRLDAYVKQSPAAFTREDGAHERVLHWIQDSRRPLLFLSGASGAGKSSVLGGYVLPTLRGGAWRVVDVPGFADPMVALEDALTAPRRRGIRLLVVFDQFEEFIILREQSNTEQGELFLTRVRELRSAPLPGVCLLFAFRTDYQSAVEALDLDELNSRLTWTVC
jgi:hypothetical protein